MLLLYFKKINIHTKETVDYYLTFETALIYLNSLNKTTPAIKNCIKQIAKLLANLHTTRKKSSLNSEIKPLIDEFFSSKKYHYLLEEEDFYSLENMQEATEQLIILLLEANNSTPITSDSLALLFQNCLQPLRAIIERANETQAQFKMQIQQIEQAFTQQRVNA